MSQKGTRIFVGKKGSIGKRYLFDRAAIADLCHRCGLQPSQIYRWQPAPVQYGADVLDFKKGRHAKAAASANDEHIGRLECLGSPLTGIRW